MSTQFTPEQRRTFEDLGWEMKYDLVGEVFVRLCYQKADQWAVINPDGLVYAVRTENIGETLGTY